MRLDLFLFESGNATSRTDAKMLITEGNVYVSGKQILKPSYSVDGKEEIRVDRSTRLYVSRGGIKLMGAISAFSLDVTEKRCIDVGASSGGFTDCLLKNGASHVIAVDAGTGQLAETLRNDERVTVMENCNARYLEPSMLPYTPGFAVMDVSFISATYIMPALRRCLSLGADFVCLIKPQFEVGRSNVGKGGIVKDERVRLDAVKRVVEFAENCGFENRGIVKSSILGGDGNVEFLAHFVAIEENFKGEP